MSNRYLGVFFLMLLLFATPVDAHSRDGDNSLELLATASVGPYLVVVEGDPRVRDGYLYLSVIVAETGSVPENIDGEISFRPLGNGQSFTAKLQPDQDHFYAVTPFDADGNWEMVLQVEGDEGKGQLSQIIRVVPLRPTASLPVKIGLGAIPFLILFIGGCIIWQKEIPFWHG